MALDDFSFTATGLAAYLGSEVSVTGELYDFAGDAKAVGVLEGASFVTSGTGDVLTVKLRGLKGLEFVNLENFSLKLLGGN